MKLTVVLGSTRENSVSLKAANKFIEGAKQARYEIKIYDAQKMNIKGCTGCKSCKTNGTDCVIQDDMPEYFRTLHTTDALLITSPNYYSYPAGHMITFSNRHYCLTNSDRTSRLKPNIKLYTIFSQGADEIYQPYPEHYNWYISTFTSKDMKLSGNLTIGGNSDINAKLEQAFSYGINLKT